MFNFQYPFFFLLLAIIPLLILLYVGLLRYKKNVALKIGNPERVKILIRYFHPQKFFLKFLLVVAAIAVLIIALANPRGIKGTRTLNRDGVDLIIVLDVSNSMLAEDVSPNRLERARQVIFRLLPRLTNNRVGLVVFAGRAYLQMPITSDYSAIKMYLSAVSPASIPTQGTVIGEALRIADLSFNPKDKKYKTVLLVSDGEDFDKGTIEIAKELANKGAMINVVGFGSSQGVMLKDYNTGGAKLDISGNPVITKLNEAGLQKIAQAGNGIYIHYTTTDQVVRSIATEINTMEGRKVTDDSLVNYASYFQWFVLVALLLLVAEWLISEKRNLRLGKLKRGIGLVALLFPVFSFGQSAQSVIEEGNKAYYQHNYLRAIDLYRSVDSAKGGFVAALNLGNALYKNKKADEAQAAYDKALQQVEKPLDKAEIYFNKGVVYQNHNLIEACINSYKAALRINPNDEQARQNLQQALRMKQQSQQNREMPEPNEQQKRPEEQNKSKISQRDAENKLKALRQQEENLHEKFRKGDSRQNDRPEKDW